MPSADRLIEFVAVVDAGSISAASRAMGLPRTTLSRRMAALEAELGVRLLHRQTRRLSLTHPGALLLERGRTVVEDMANAWAVVVQAGDDPRGRLRISVPPGRLHHPLIFGFLKRHPAVDLEVIASTRRLDLLADRVDVALRFGGELAEGLVARKLFMGRSGAVASPAYLARRGTPTDLEQLATHDCLLSFDAGWRRAETWPTFEGTKTKVVGSLVSDEAPVRLRAALDGYGIALLPNIMTAAYRNSGQLTGVLQNIVGSTTGASLVFPDRRFLPPQVRAFIDFAVELYADGVPLPSIALPMVRSPNLKRPHRS